MKPLFSKPLDTAFYVGLVIILIPHISRRIKPESKAIINGYLQRLQTQLKAIRLNKIIEIISKHPVVMPVICLNALFLACLGYRFYYNEMQLEGKPVHIIQIGDVVFIGCLILLLFVLGRVMTSFKEGEGTARKIFRVLTWLFFVILLLFTLMSVFDTVAKFQEPKPFVLGIFEFFGIIMGLIAISAISIFLLLRVFIIVLYVLRQTYLILFPAERDAMEIMLITIVSILGILKLVAGYL